MQWLFSSILASLSCVAALVAIWCLWRVRKLLAGVSARSLTTLSDEVAELTYASESMRSQLKRLAARVGMREVRHRGEEQRETEEETAPVRGSREERLSKLREIARGKGFRL
jgi:uncharacterized coiled-coil protein SlyX